ncbi:hypothetical protein UFOVP73_33 [uncultured Caudovirales phage]|uniref:Uncharacterized protein n=1 Tax=uncultured Caudovirales phage TaxID=2100421 RepID=A0A6J5KU95_9CAUD|nr:hypothetical protein UFOVP73_33 [uncultured Caudovirales phage]CAB5195162.1 hypothetical protein UFOVP170_55 [uncultured Caudovirales phage]
MIIDLYDPESIARWVLLHPHRHGPQINWFSRYDRFVPAIEAARKIVRAAL